MSTILSDPVNIKSVENEDRIGIRSQHFWSDSWEWVPRVMCHTLWLGGLRERERTVETGNVKRGRRFLWFFFQRHHGDPCQVVYSLLLTLSFEGSR